MLPDCGTVCAQRDSLWMCNRCMLLSGSDGLLWNMTTFTASRSVRREEGSVTAWRGLHWTMHDTCGEVAGLGHCWGSLDHDYGFWSCGL